MINFAKIWDILITKFPAFMEGVEITLQLAFFTVLFGSLLGLVVAVCRRTRLLPLRWLMNAYVAFIRGTPLLVQVLLVVYGLPQLGIRFPRMTLCIIALVINSGAYMAELIRAGLQSVEKGQVEAAESLGMSSGQTMLYIILPQAVKVTLPAGKPTTGPPSARFWVVRESRMLWRSAGFLGVRTSSTSNSPSSSLTMFLGRLRRPPTDTVLPTMP